MPIHGANHSIQGKNFGEASQAQDAAVQESLKDILDTLKGGKKARVKEREEHQKSQQKKTDANANTMLRREASAQDLETSFFNKLGEGQKAALQSSMSQHMKQTVNDIVEDQFKSEFEDSSEDEVKLSKKAQDMKQEKEKVVKQKMARTLIQSQGQQPHAMAQQAAVANAADTLKGQQKRTDNTQATNTVGTEVQLSGEKQPTESTFLDKSERQKRLLKRYVGSFSDLLIKDDGKRKKEANMVKEQLLKLGVSEGKIRDAEGKVKAMLSRDLKQKLKNGFINYALNFAPNQMSKGLKESQGTYNRLLDAAEQVNLFGTTDQDDLESLGRSELRDFVSDELDKEIMRHYVAKDDPRALLEIFKSYDDLAKIADFDTVKYAENFGKKIEDWGLQGAIFLDDQGIIDTDHDGDADQNQQEEPEAQLSEEEQEELEDRLRMLISQSYVISGPFRKLEVQLKIQKTMSELKKSGKVSEESLGKLKEEAQGVAKMRLTQMMRESLEERASLSVLKGAQYDLVKKKFQTATKRLKALGDEPSKKTVKELTDEINRAFFPLIREDYLKIKMHLDMSKTSPSLKNRAKQLLNHLERLKEETEILDDIEPGMFQKSRLGGSQLDNSITEAA